ncbi:hypothetical protein, partial [Rhodovarius sp.]|uniref:hypothetical protein n=1 Tax=Rhodovarius sp. TaxID=2972673 RepID=UPI0033418D24
PWPPSSSSSSGSMSPEPRSSSVQTESFERINMLAMAAILAVSGPARVGRRQYSMLYIRHVRTKSVLSKPKTVSSPRDYVVAGCALP